MSCSFLEFNNRFAQSGLLVYIFKKVERCFLRFCVDCWKYLFVFSVLFIIVVDIDLYYTKIFTNNSRHCISEYEISVLLLLFVH